MRERGWDVTPVTNNLATSPLPPPTAAPPLPQWGVWPTVQRTPKARELQLRRHGWIANPLFLALVGTLLFAGCGAKRSGASPTTTVTQASSSSSITPTPAVSSTTPDVTVVSAPPSSSPATGVPLPPLPNSPGTTHAPPSPSSGTPAACSTPSLVASVKPIPGGGGHEYYLIVLRNTGTRACIIVGFPGVSFLSGSHQEIGRAAIRSGPTGAPIRLQPNQSASAELITVPNLCNGGQVPKSTYVQIFPPNQTNILVVPGKVALCDSTILTLQAGTAPPAAR